MKFADILSLAVRNLREAKLRASLTTMGVVVGVAVIVTMVSFGLGLQRNAVQRFKDLDLFNEITVSGQSLDSIVAQAISGPKPTGDNANAGGDNTNGNGGNANARAVNGNARGEGDRRGEREDGAPRRGGRLQSNATRVLDDAAIQEIAQLPGVASVEPNVSLYIYVRANGRVQMQSVGGALVPNQASRFRSFSAGRMIARADAEEAVVDENFLNAFGYAKPEDAVGQTVELLAPRGPRDERANGSNAQATDQGNAERGSNERASGDAGRGKSAEDEGGMSFFGLPLGGEEATSDVASRAFKLVGARLVAEVTRLAQPGRLRARTRARRDQGGAGGRLPDGRRARDRSGQADRR